MILITFFVPLAVELLKLYLQNTSSKHDDKILEVVQDSVCYLADKDNNDIRPDLVPIMDSYIMTGSKNDSR